MLFPLVILLLLTCCNSKELLHTQLHVVVVLSVEDGGNYSTARTQGTDIVQGACHATVHINNSTHLLDQYELVPVPVLVPDCDSVRGLDYLLESLLDPAMNVVRVTGMFCDKVAQVYSPVLNHWARSVHISGAQIQDRTQLLPSLLPSPGDVAEAVVSLLYRLDWRRFGIVYYNTAFSQHSYYNFIHLAKSVISHVTNGRQSSSIPVAMYELRGTSQREVHLLVQSLESSGVHIFVVLLARPIATVVMQEVFKEGMVWPKYVWVFVHLDPVTLSLSPVWENVIFMSYSLGESSSSSNRRIPHWSPYRHLLYESVWALALTWNNSLSSSSNIKTCLCNEERKKCVSKVRTGVSRGTCSEANVTSSYERDGSLQFDVAVVQSNKSVRIGVYDYTNLSIVLNDSLLHPIPPDTFQYVVLTIPLGLAVPFFVWLLLMYTLLTLNLILYLILRNEREVKASSVPLSVWIFVGNYLLLISSTINVVLVTGDFISDRQRLRHTSCNIELISASVGFDIIVATALVRTLRIYQIFHYFGKLNRSWSDSRLVLVIAAIIFIKLLLFVLWMSIDNYHLIDTPKFRQDVVPPDYLVVHSCYCHYMAIWIVAVYVYTVFLLALLFILAVKTKMVHRANFNDTKKLTILILGLLIMLVIFGLLWGILRQVGFPAASYVLLSLGYSLSVLLMQLCLFFPKVLPPLYRRTKIIICKCRSYESSSSSSVYSYWTTNYTKYDQTQDLVSVVM